MALYFLCLSKWWASQYLYIRSMSISGSCWCSFILTVSVRIMCRLNTRSWTCSFRSATQHISKVWTILADLFCLLHDGCYVPALGKVCHAVPGPLQHTSGSSSVTDEDALHWSSVMFPPARTGTWWPASLLVQSSGSRTEIEQIDPHNTMTESIPSIFVVKVHMQKH